MMSASLVFSAAVTLLLYFKGASAAETPDWWETATIYQIYPRSFMDSNGDGVGDLNGITLKLPYIKELGVQAIWLSPIYESPMADFGYDISNYTRIDPVFGTMDDFDALIKRAHRLGIKVILDFVPNHSSIECEWFKKSVRREKGYEYFYVWSDGKINNATGERQPPSNWRSFFGGGASAWAWNEERQQYYLHQFLAVQADFNLTNPNVRAHLIGVLLFWLERGVDGIRVDAVSTFFETRLQNGTFPNEPNNTRIYTMNLPKNAELLYEWHDVLERYRQWNGGDTRLIIAETDGNASIVSSYISDGGARNGSQIPMNLYLINLNGTINAKTVEAQANEYMSVIWSKYQLANWITSNHDNARLATRWGYNRVDLTTVIVHALPGTVLTYYGEEIGMTDGKIFCTKKCDARLPSRTPMQWDTSLNAGFSTANSTWLPVSSNYPLINVKAQSKGGRSSLQIFKGMMKLKQTSAFKAYKEDGGFEYGALSEEVFQVVRTNNIDEEYRVLANFGDQIAHVDGLTNKTMIYVLLNSYSPHQKGAKIDLSKRIYLMPYEAVVLRWTAFVQ